MIRRVVIVVLFTSLAAVAAEPVKKSAAVVKVVTDRPDAVYRAGETVTFTITVTDGGKPVDRVALSYVIDKDGYGKPMSAGIVTSGPKPLTVTGKLDEPGFLRCRVTGKAGVVSLAGQAGAAVDPEKIGPSLPPPDDFDAYWAAQKAALAKVPMNPRLTPVPAKMPGVEAFDVQLDCTPGIPGTPGIRGTSGYFARPTGAKPKSCPAILHVHGAGVRGSSLTPPVTDATRGRIGMDINAHGIANGRPAAFYDELAKGELAGYRTAGRQTRDGVYFRGMFLRLVRAIDFLAAQPEWDGKVMIVTGGSQGGYQSIVAAGLDPRVTCIAAGVPAGCDHSGNAAHRIAGWPKLVPVGEAGVPDPAVLQNARYFDAMNFATRFRGEAILSVGFIDSTCPPTSVYAAYNQLRGPRQMVNEPLMGHANSPNVMKHFGQFMDAHIAKGRP